MVLTQEKFQAVIDDVYEGFSLKEALEKHGVKRQTFYDYKKRNVLCADAYASARESQTDLLIDQLREISDDKDLDPNRARNMIAVRQWYASKVMPSTYGDRVELNVTHQASITDALAAATARALPMRDLGEVTDVEVIEPKHLSHDGAAGSAPAAQYTSKDNSSNVPMKKEIGNEDIFD